MRELSEEYFSPSARTFQNNTRPSHVWDSTLLDDPSLIDTDCYDSTLPSPSSPKVLASPYILPKSEVSPDIKANQAFNFGTFDDWMRWDNAGDSTLPLSPTSDFFPDLKVEPSSSSPTMSGLEFQGSGRGAVPEVNMFNEDIEEPLFQGLNNQSFDDMPRENLYSTPLSWSRPSSGRYMSTSTLSPQHEFVLRNIAMPSSSFPGSPSSTSSPEAAEVSYPSPQKSRKRKPSVEISEQEHDLSHDEIEEIEEIEEEEVVRSALTKRGVPVKKTAHNMIEKRYRTNLNDKIAMLRDSVPSLRVVNHKKSRTSNTTEEEGEDLQGLTPAHKLNKATVLSKATEYISHLEKRNRVLGKENKELRGRVDAFEMLVMARQGMGMGGMGVYGGSVMQGGRMAMGQQRGSGGMEGMSGVM